MPGAPQRPGPGYAGYGQPAPSRSGTSWPLIIGLIVGGGGLLLIGLVVVVALIIYSSSGGGDDDLAQVDPIGEVAEPVVPFVPPVTPSPAPNVPPANPGVSPGSALGPPMPNPNLPAGSFGDPPRNPSEGAGNGAAGEFGSGAPAGNSGQPAGGFGTPIDGGSQGSGSSASGGAAGADRLESMLTAIGKWNTGGTARTGFRTVPDQELEIYQYSWLTELLPLIGQQKLYDQIDFKKTFIVGSNQLVPRRVIAQFLNPADDRQRFDGHYFKFFGLSHFVGMAGIETTRNSKAADLERSDAKAGMFGYAEVARSEQITDGTSNTIMLIGSGKVAGPWICGGGATVRGAREPFFDSFTGFGSEGGDGAIVALADGSVRRIPSDIDPEVFRALCTIRGGEQVDVNAVTKPEEDWSIKPHEIDETIVIEEDEE